MEKVSKTLFLSYSWADGQQFVSRLYSDLKAHGYEPWMDSENMPSRGRSLPQEIIAELNRSDRMIAVIGPGSLASEACKAERAYAFSSGKVVTAVLRLGERKSVPAELAEDFVPDFRESRYYNEAYKELLRVLAEPVTEPATLFDVPPFPQHLQSRQAQIAEIRTALRSRKLTGENIISPPTFALHGMGGIGKTVLATLVARDYSIRREFKDGIIWLTQGRHPDRLASIRKLGRALGADLTDWSSEEIARPKLSDTLKNKQCLVILDDLWDAPDAEPFLRALSAHWALLITTRDVNLLKMIGVTEARSFEIEVLSNEEAVGLLTKWSGQSGNSLPPEVGLVALECGNLPLALAMIGAMVGNNPQRWINALYKLQNADLEKIRRQFPDYPYPNLMRAIEVSVDTLDDSLKARYLDFAVFSKNAALPEAVFETFWTPLSLDKWDVQDALDRFVSLSLARRDHEGLYSLHDLQSDYTRRKTGDQNLAALHKRLLAAYRLKCADGWRTGPNDGYFFEHILLHLRAAGSQDEHDKLLVDFSWIRAKLDAVGVLALANDYAGSDDNNWASEWATFLRKNAHLLRGGDPYLPAGDIIVHLASEDSGPAVRGSVTEWLNRGEYERLWLRRSNGETAATKYHQVLKGHNGQIEGLLSLSEHSLLSWSDDQSLIVWDVTSGTERLKFTAHTAVIRGALQLPDGLVLSWADEPTAYVWDPLSGSIISRFTAGEGAVAGAVLTPSRGAITWTGNVARLWSVDSGEVIRELEGHALNLRTVACLPDGKILALSRDSVTVWDPETGESSHLSAINDEENWNIIPLGNGCLFWSGYQFRALFEPNELDTSWRAKPAFGFSDSQLSRGSVEGAILLPWGGILTWGPLTRGGNIWLDLGDALVVGSIIPSSRPLAGGRLLDSNSQVLTWSMDGSLDIWRTRLDEKLESSVKLTKTSNNRASLWLEKGSEAEAFVGPAWPEETPETLVKDSEASGTPAAKVYSTVILDRERTFVGHTNSVIGTLILPTNELVSWSTDGSIRIWDQETGECLHVFTGHTGLIVNVVSLGVGLIASCSTQDDRVLLWKITRDHEVTEGLINPVQITRTTVLPNGDVLACGENGRMVSWDPSTARERWIFEGHSKPILGLTIVSSQQFVSWSWDRSIRIWSTSSGLCTAVLTGHKRAINGCFPFHDHFVSWSDDLTIRVWSKTGECLASLEGHSAPISGVQPIGAQSFASWSRDGSIQLWRMNLSISQLAVENVGTCRGHERAVVGVSVLDSDEILSWSWDGTLRVWDAHDGAPLRSAKAHDGPVTGTLTTTSGDLIISWSDDGSICVWPRKGESGPRQIAKHESGVLGVRLIGPFSISARTQDGTACIWAIDSGRSLAEIKIDEGPILEVVAMDETRFLIRTLTRVLYWKPGQDGQPDTIAREDAFAVMETLENNEHLLWSWSRSGVVLWDSYSEQPTLRGDWYCASDYGDHATMCYLPDGNQLYYSAEGLLMFRDASTGMCCNVIRNRYPGETNNDDRLIPLTEHSARGTLMAVNYFDLLRVIPFNFSQDVCHWQSDRRIEKVENILPSGAVVLLRSESRPTFVQLWMGNEHTRVSRLLLYSRGKNEDELM